MPILYDARPVCTVCGRLKHEEKGWWQIVLGCMGGELRLVEWDSSLVPYADGCACGESCAHKAVSRFMATRTLDAPSAHTDEALEAAHA